MSLSMKEKELAAVGISVAAGCRPCTNYHLREARQAGAGEEEIRRAGEIAVAVRHQAAEVMAAHLLGQLGEAAAAKPGAEMAAFSRIDRLAAIGSAFAVNCPATLKAHLAAGGKFGLTQGESEEIAKLATFIRGKAISHVEKLIPRPEEEESEGKPEPGKPAGCFAMNCC